MRPSPFRLFSLLRLSIVALLAVSSTSLAQTNPPVITSSTNTLGTVGEPFAYVITASGNPTGFGASNLPSGFLPPGAGLFPPDSNKITGLPQTAGVFTARISASNAFGSSTTNTNLFITVNPPPAPQLESPVTVFGVQGQPLNYPLLSSPSHSNVPTSFTVSNLPPGLAVAPTTSTNSPYTNVTVTNYSVGGVVSSGAGSVGSFVVPVVVSNQGGVTTNNVTFIINPSNAPVFTVTTNPVTATVGVPFNYDATAINGPLFFRAMSISIGTYATNPFTGNVTTNFSAPVNLNGTNGIVAGTLTNGLSFSNVTVGSSTFARIYGTPGGAYAVRITMRADNNFGFAVTNLTVAVFNPTPNIVISQPLGEKRYVDGSSFYLNAQVFDDPDDIIVPSTVKFQENGVELPGSVGNYGEYFGVEYYPEVANPAITASGQNSLGVTKVSAPPTAMFNTPAQFPLPTVEMLPLNFGQQPTAGGRVLLSARATIPSTLVTIDRVEFYVNKVYVGSSRAAVTADGIYEYEWTTPATPGSFQVTARAVSLNYREPLTNVPWWASVIARKPTIVNTKQGTTPSVLITAPSSNGNVSVGVANRIQAAAQSAGGAIQSVEFFVNGVRVPAQIIDPLTGTVVLNQPNPDTQVPFEVDFFPNSYGAYEIYAVVTGSNGLQAVSPSVIVNAPSGFAPTVSITTPKDGLRVPQGPLAIGWTSNDVDGSVQSVQILANGASVGAPQAAGSGFIVFNPTSQGQFVFVARASDNQGNVTDSTPVTVTIDNTATSPNPSVVLDQRTIADQGYVYGSQAYFNATATPQGTNTIPTNGVSFLLGSDRQLAALPGGIESGGQEVYAAGYSFNSGSPTTIAGQATDSAGNTGLSEFSTLYYGSPFSPLPTVDMLPLPPSSQTAAGGSIQLRAKANFPTSQFNQGATSTARVEFYANGVFLGIGTPNTNSVTARSFSHTFDWIMPTNTNSFKLTARAVQLNYNTPSPVNSNAVIPYYGATLSPQIITANTFSNSAPTISISDPSTNGLQIGVGTTRQIAASVTTATNASVKEVQWYIDGLFVTNTTTFPYIYNLAPTNTGLFSLAAVVVDNFGLQGSSDVRTISAVSGVPPTVSITTPNTNLVTPLAILNVGWTSKDTDGSVSQVQILVNGVVFRTFTRAVDGAEIVGSGITPYVPPSQGVYAFVARATDNRGNVTDSVPVTVTVDNTAPPVLPVVNLLPDTFADQRYVLGSQIYFNATATARGSNSILSNGVSFYLLGPETEESATKTSITLGTDPIYASQLYTFNTPVTDVLALAEDSSTNVGSSSIYLLNATRGPLAPLPAVSIATNLPPSATAVAGGVVQLQAKASFPTPAGVASGTNSSGTDNNRVEFYADGAYLGTATPNTNPSTLNTFTHFLNWTTPATSNSFKITARAIGLNFAEGGSAGSTNTAFYYGAKVSAGILAVNTLSNRPPMVSITQPATNNTPVGVGITNQIVATVTNLATNASVKEVQFYVDGLFVTNDTTFPYIYDFAPTNTGLYSLAAVVMDNFGLQGSSGVRTVSAVSGSAPTVSITTPKTGLTTPQTTLNIGWSANDTDGSVVSVQLLVNGAVVNASSSGSGLFPFVPSSQGQYAFVARATDNLGNVTDSTPVTVTVNNSVPPVLPVVNLLPDTFSDQRYVAGSQLYFNATATPRGTNTILSNGVAFYLQGPETYVDAALTTLKLGTDSIYASPVYTFNTSVGGVLADAEDSSGNIGGSDLYPLNAPSRATRVARAPLPVVDVLTNLPPSATAVAGGVVQLQAKASFPAPAGTNSAGTNPVTRVEFYADGAYLGIATPNTNPSTLNTFTHFLNWTAPTNSNSFKITARAIALNFSENDATGSGGATNTLNFFGSRVSPSILAFNTLTNRAPQVSITQPSSNNTPVGVGITNQIVATVTNLATNASVKEVQFYVDGIFQTNVTTFPYIFNFAPTNTGLYSLAAVVMDNFGLQGSSGVRTVSAVSGNAPTVSITSPPTGTELPYSSSVNIQYTSSDTDGSVQKIELLRNGVVLQTLEAPTTPLIGNGLLTDLPPSFGLYVYVVRATDNLGNVTASFPVNVTITSNASSSAPVVAILQQSIADRAYVSGSRFFLNGQAQAQGAATIKTNSFKFNLNGREYTGAPSDLDYGAGEIFTKLASADELTGPAVNPNSLTASAVDSNDRTGVSPATVLYTAVSQKPLPTVTMLAPVEGSSQVAGGYVTLRAQVVFPSSTPDQRRVEFYANEVYLGESTAPPVPDPQNPNLLVYSFLWKTPTTPASFSIQARAVALNFSVTTATDVENNDFYGSSVSLDSIALNTIPGSAPDVVITQPTNGAEVRTGTPFNIQATASVQQTTIVAPSAGAWSVATNTNVPAPRPYRVGDNVAPNTTVGTFTNASFGNLPVPATGTIRQIASSGPVASAASLVSYGGGNIQRVEFYANGLLIGTDTIAPYSTTFTPPSSGPYTLVAHAYSTDGVLGISAPVSVNSKLSEPPKVEIVSPPSGSTLSVNQPVTLVAQASDPDGSVVSVNFEVNGAPVAGSLSSFGAWTGIFTPTSGGQYSCVAIATDNSGNETRSTPPSVYTVSSTNNLTVNLTAPTNNSTFTLGTPVLLAANATTSPGTVTGLQFYVNFQPVGPLLTNAPYFFAFDPRAVGTYSVFAVASDSNGASKASTPAVGFTVEAAPDSGVPTISLSAPGNDTLVSGSRVYLNYTVSTSQPDSIPASNVRIYVDGTEVTGVAKIGPAGDTFGVPWTVGTKASYSIFATVRDTAGTTAFSGISTIRTTPSRQTLPQVEMLPFESAYPYLAVDVPVKLRARANFGLNAAPQTLEFYANGVLIGAGVAGTTTLGWTSYSLDWVPNIPTAAIGLTGAISGSTLTVSAVAPGSESLSVGMLVTGNGVAPNTRITALGTGTGGAGTYTVTPSQSVSSGVLTALGTISLNARASGVNAQVTSGTGAGAAVTNYYGSAVSSNQPNPPVTRLPIYGVPSPDAGSRKPNGQFVVWMVNELLYRAPTYPEYQQYLAMLGGNPTANGTAPAKAEVVMRIMGFDSAKNLFNPSSEYSKTSAIAFAPFGRLPGTSAYPLVPSEDGIINFISLLESDPTPLPLTGAYAGFAGAPWRATYGMARAFEAMIFDSVNFNNAYPTVTGLFGMDFVIWMAGNTGSPAIPAVMFPGRPDGGNSRVDLANMIDDTPTLVGADALAIRHGAGAAFQSEFVATMLWSGLAGTDPNSVEKNFQLKLNSAALNFQLSGGWSFAAALPYSKTVVQNYLISNGYADPLPAAAARSQTISFVMPRVVYTGRTYTLRARASSALPVRFELDADSASRATLVGNKLTITQPGSIIVRAIQDGGSPALSAGRATTRSVTYNPASISRTSSAVQR